MAIAYVKNTGVPLLLCSQSLLLWSFTDALLLVLKWKSMRRFRAGHQHLAEAVQECRTLVSRHLVLYSSGIVVDEFLVFLALLFSVDLVMWRDVSKSAFVFGFGTFLLISCSYAKDLNFK
jgi:hypothetical protein